MRRAKLSVLSTLVASLFLIGLPVAHADAASSGYLHRQDQQIVDGAGSAVRLHGVNLGNWLVWESQLMGSPTLASVGESQIMKGLTTLVGAAAADQFRTDVRNAYITQGDIQTIAGLGFNSVRVPLPYTLLEDDSAPYQYKDEGWRVLDDLVSWAQQSGIYVIFDLHAAPGGQNTFFHSSAVKGVAAMWKNADFQARTVALWKAIAARYADSTAVGGFDVLNEPQAPKNAALLSMYQRIIAAIRSVDTHHLIFLEGANTSRTFTVFTSRLDENMAISLHQYVWTMLSPANNLTQADDSAKRLDVPLWVGEMGWDSYAHTASQVKMMNADPEVSGWAFWTWKASKNNAWKWGETFSVTPAWQKTIAWIAASWRAKPTAATALQGMQDYVKAIGSAPQDARTLSILEGTGS
jgi:aryl-phospho-beta-D-glucosidase BglC (GH1 family)